MDTFISYFFYFIIYSCLGYICEVVYVAIITKHIGDRGFLFGPLVPIYGFGALLILLCLNWAYNYWYIVVPLGFLITTVLEYVVSFFMELFFKKRWWDYSDKFLNINGRVCLRNSIMFTILVVIVIYLLHPYPVTGLVNLIMDINALKWTLFIVIFVLFSADTIVSTTKHVKLATVITKLEQIKTFASDELDKAKEYITKSRAYDKLAKLSQRYPSFKIKLNWARITISDLILKVKEKVGFKKWEK